MPWIDSKQAGRAGVVSSANDALGRVSGRRLTALKSHRTRHRYGLLSAGVQGGNLNRGSFLDILRPRGRRVAGFASFLGPYRVGVEAKTMGDVTNISPPAVRLANKLQVSEIFEVSVKTVDLWVRRGCPFVRRGDLRTPWIFDLLAVAEWRFTRPKRVRVENPDELKPKDRRDWYEGERVREKVAELRANLITRDEFNAEKTRITMAISECLDQLPDKLTTACELPPVAIAALRETLDRERAAMAIE